MGDLQTYFYLALISVVMIGLTLTFVGIAAAGLRRWFRRAHGQTPLTFWLVGSAITLVLLFIVLGTAGLLFRFVLYVTAGCAGARLLPLHSPPHPGGGGRGDPGVRRPAHRRLSLPPLL